MKKLEDLFQSGIGELDLHLSPLATSSLMAFIQLLLKWNRAYNLIGTDDPEIILTEHVLDSLTIAPYIKNQRIIDVGTGAGFPGIPLAIAFPAKQFVLLDSVGKKIRFLIQAVSELKLQNVEVVQSRVETYSPSKCFDHVVLRAFGTISDIIKKTKHLLCPNGSWLMMKGVYPETEMAKLPYEAKVYPLKIPGVTKTRHLVCIEKGNND